MLFPFTHGWTEDVSSILEAAKSLYLNRPVSFVYKIRLCWMFVFLQMLNYVLFSADLCDNWWVVLANGGIFGVGNPFEFFC